MPSRVFLPCRMRPPVPSREPELANFARASMPVALETFHPCIPWRSVEGRRRLPGMNSRRAPHSASDGRGGEFFSLESPAGGGGREGEEICFLQSVRQAAEERGKLFFPEFSAERRQQGGSCPRSARQAARERGGSRFPGIFGRESEAVEVVFPRSAKTPGRRTVRAFETAEMRRPVSRRPAIRRVRRARRPRASFQWRSSTAG